MSVSAMKHDTGQPPGPTSSLPSGAASPSSTDALSEHSSTSLDDAAAMMVVDSTQMTELTIVMPDGASDVLFIDAKTQIMDALVQIAAAHKLNPAQHKFTIQSPGRRPVDCKPSQQVGAVGATTLHLVNKKAEKERRSAKQDKGFEMKTRLQVNLPRGQLFVSRVSSNITLAEIFKMVCEQKALDPYKHELRHATKPDLPINMADTLNNYGVNELTIVNITVADQSPPSRFEDVDDVQSVASTQVSNWTSASMADSRASSTLGRDHRKKKGLLSIFSRKKEAKFRLSMDSGHSRMSSGPSQVLSHEAPASSTALSAHKTLQYTSAQRIPEQDVPHYATLPKPTAPRQGKKRPAPPPPALSQVSGSVVTTTSRTDTSIVANGNHGGRHSYHGNNMQSDVSTRSPVGSVITQDEDWKIKNNNNILAQKSESMSLDGSVVSESTVVSSSTLHARRPQQRKKRKAPSPPTMLAVRNEIPEAIPEVPEAVSTQELSHAGGNNKDQNSAEVEAVEQLVLATASIDSIPPDSPDAAASQAVDTPTTSQAEHYNNTEETAKLEEDSNAELEEAPTILPVGGGTKTKKSQRPSIFTLVNNDTITSQATNNTRPCHFVAPPPPLSPPSPPIATHAFATQTSVDLEPLPDDQKLTLEGSTQHGGADLHVLNDSFSSVRSSSSNSTAVSLATIDDIQHHFNSTILAAEEAYRTQQNEAVEMKEGLDSVQSDGEISGHARTNSLTSTMSSASFTASYDVQPPDVATTAVITNDSDVSENSSIAKYDFIESKRQNDVESDDDDIDDIDKFIDDILADDDDQVMLVSQRSLADESPPIQNSTYKTVEETADANEAHMTVINPASDDHHPKTDTVTEKKVIKPVAIQFDDDSDHTPDLTDAEEELTDELHESYNEDVQMSAVSALPECEEIVMMTDSAISLSDETVERKQMSHPNYDAPTSVASKDGSFNVNEQAEKVEVVKPVHNTEAYTVTDNVKTSNVPVKVASKEAVKEAKPVHHTKEIKVVEDANSSVKQRKVSPGAFIRNAAGSYTVTGLYFKEQNFQYTNRGVSSTEPEDRVIVSVNKVNTKTKVIPKEVISIPRDDEVKTLHVENAANEFVDERPADPVSKVTNDTSVLGNKEEKKNERYSEMVFKPKPEGELEHVLEEKSISMMARFPRSVQQGNRYTSEPQKTAVEAALNSHQKTSSTADDIDIKLASSVIKEDSSEGDSSNINKMEENERLHSDYKQLQSQFSRWQEQLAKNRALLSHIQTPFQRSLKLRDNTNLQNNLDSSSSELSVSNKTSVESDWNNEHLRPSSVKTTYSKASGTSLGSSSDDRNVNNNSKNTNTALHNNALIPPPPPPPPLILENKTKLNITKPAADLRKTSTARRRFEPQLDPREELMIAIREAGGRSSLKKVPVSKTKWYEKKL